MAHFLHTQTQWGFVEWAVCRRDCIFLNRTTTIFSTFSSTIQAIRLSSRFLLTMNLQWRREENLCIMVSVSCWTPLHWNITMNGCCSPAPLLMLGAHRAPTHTHTVYVYVLCVFVYYNIYYGLWLIFATFPTDYLVWIVIRAIFNYRSSGGINASSPPMHSNIFCLVHLSRTIEAITGFYQLPFVNLPSMGWKFSVKRIRNAVSLYRGWMTADAYICNRMPTRIYIVAISLILCILYVYKYSTHTIINLKLSRVCVECEQTF